MEPDDGEIRWEEGEAIYRDAWFVPGFFIMIFAAVIGWKHLRRWCSRLLRRWRARGAGRLPSKGP